MFFLSCVLVLNPLGERLLGSQQNSLNEVNVKRERLTQIVLAIVGLLNLALIYFLYMDLRHSSWLLERKNELDPMFLSFFIPVGVFLLMAARRPSEHRSMIASLLYGVRPLDLQVFLFVPVVFLVVAFLASSIPARRALRVDPIVALRDN